MLQYRIGYNSLEPSKTYDMNELECLFFEKLSSKLEENDMIDLIGLTRKSDGSLSVGYSGFPIGTVKLQGRKHWMVTLKNLYDQNSISGSVQDFIPKIDDWIKYTKKYIVKEIKGRR